MRGRKKEKNGKQINLFLDKEEIEQLEILSSKENINKSAYIGLLIRQRYRTANIGGFVKGLSEDIDNIQKKRRLLEEEEEKIKERLRILANAVIIKEHQKAIEKELEQDRKNYIRILTRKIIEGEQAKELQRLAASHSALLNYQWGPEELLQEAYTLTKPITEGKNDI